MHIVVLAKAVPDYEVPAVDFELVNNRAHSRYTRMIGLYDENAIEVGAQLKEKYSASLTVISFGSNDDIPVLRKALAMGGDKLVMINGTSDDPGIIAANLKMALDKLDDVDLVLCGRQSADLDRGIVPGTLAGMLGQLFISQVSNVEKLNEDWKVTQITETGIREMQFASKAVLSITDDQNNVPRIPPVRGIMAAKKKPVEKIEEIQADTMSVQELSVEIPKMESKCEIITVEDIGEAAKMLLKRLKEERYL